MISPLSTRSNRAIRLTVLAAVMFCLVWASSVATPVGASPRVARTQVKAKAKPSSKPKGKARPKTTVRRRVRRTTTQPTSLGVALPVTTVLTLPPEVTLGSTTIPVTTVPPTSLPPTSLAPTTVVLPTPQEYLSRALTFIETYSARTRLVDVKSITAVARAKGEGVGTIEAVYPIIREALSKLGDRHSQLLNPTSAQSLLQGTSKGFGIRVYPPDVMWVTPGSPAELAGLRTLDRLVSFNGKAWNKTTTADRSVDIAVVRASRPDLGEFEVTLNSAVISTAETPSARVLGTQLGYIDLPGSIGSRSAEENFSRVGLSAINAVEQAIRPCGWVLDLRRNSGGYVYSMMSVLEPFLSDSSPSGFIFGDGRKELLSYSNGQLLAGTRLAWQAESVVRLQSATVPVAVLVSNFTGSAGELAVISFIGRPSSRSFGAQSVGVTSANVGIRLADGGFLLVTNSYDLDRNGNVYDQKLSADVGLIVDWATFATATDPVLEAARQWLVADPSCAGR